MTTTNNMIAPQLWFTIGEQLALEVAKSFAATNPVAGLAISVVQAAMKVNADRTAALNAHSLLFQKAQLEGWKDTDPRWDTALADQEARIRDVDARHAAQMSGRA